MALFLCGSASGDDVVWQLFDKVIALVADERTIWRFGCLEPCARERGTAWKGLT